MKIRDWIIILCIASTNNITIPWYAWAFILTNWGILTINEFIKNKRGKQNEI